MEDTAWKELHLLIYVLLYVCVRSAHVHFCKYYANNMHMHVHVPVISLACIVSVRSGNMHIVKLDSSEHQLHVDLLDYNNIMTTD